MIDPSIALGVKPPQPIADPMETYAKVQQIKSAQQAYVLNSERLKQEQQQTEIAAQKTRDNQVIRDTQAQFGGDLDKTLAALSGKIHPDAWAGLQKHVNETKEQLGKLDEQKRKQIEFQLGHVSDAGLMVLNAPPEQKEAEWQRQRARLSALGMNVPEQYPGDDAIKSEVGYAKWLTDSQAKAKAEREARAAEDAHAGAVREAELQPLKVQKAQSDAQLAAMEAAGQKPIQPAERARLEREEAAAKESARHNRAVEARMAQATSVGLSDQKTRLALSVANQFDNEPMVKNYNTIAEAKNFVDSLGSGKAGNAGDDQALLYAFAKAMDPQSVVREGEYATVQKYSQSWADTFGFKAARIFSNSPFLSDDARRMMKETVSKKAASAQKSYENIHNEYGRRIERASGVQNGKDFLTNYGGAFGGQQGGTVRLMAPDGKTVKEVPAAEAEHYISLGAKKL